MGFRYLDQIASRRSIQQFLELVDLALGGSDSAENVFNLSHQLRDSPPMRLCERVLRRDPAAQALIEQRRPVGPYNLAALKACAKGTLGHTYAVVMETLQYDINFFPRPDYFASLETDADYINYRVYATHDIHHIISGFSLDDFGEAGVISISVGQFNHPGLGFTDLVVLLMNFLRNDMPDDELADQRQQIHTASYVFKLIGDGLNMAARAKPLFPVLWEQHFDRDLEELRRELGVEPVREGPFSWYSNPAIMAALA